MSTTRREFIAASAATGGLLSLGAPSALARMLQGGGEAPKKLRILVLGGTRFIGPHFVEYALSRGHEITLFNRGRSNPDMFNDLETLIGDRDPERGDGLSALKDREWDCVVDTSGFITRHVEASTELLKDSVHRYLFISSISAYADGSIHGMTEKEAVGTLDDPYVEEVTGETYGPLKAYCENACTNTFGDRATIIRPGYIVGPLDNTDRFTYWVKRIDRGGEVLVPGAAEHPVQFIDARDLMEWSLHMLENDTGGVYNAVGPKDLMGMGAMCETMREVSQSDASFTWVDASWLEERDELFPIYVNPDGPYGGYGDVSNALAVGAGLRFRPLSETTRDLLDWWGTLSDERTARLREAIESDREKNLLEAWKEHIAG
ncbi:MAG: NAD-dependent epimerase/dehydratase family protein [Planctomycetota bacterium]|jgi:2'-hydroxyisoflavone reductase